MSSWRHYLLLTFLLFLQIGPHNLTTSTLNTEGDFAFDISEDLQPEIYHKLVKECPVRRLWGVPDMPAYVGHIFKLQIPKEAFSGKIFSYKVSGIGSPLPSWLTMDEHKGLLRGVPENKDRGEHRLKVTAISKSGHSVKCPMATDVFTIEVIENKEIPVVSDVTEQCHMGEDEVQLKIIIDRPLQQLTPKQKLTAINKLANFMGLDPSAFTIQTYELIDDKSDNVEVLMSGSGDRKKKNRKSSTEIMLTVGCSSKFWQKHGILVHQIKEQAKDGTISFILHLPVTGWKVITHKQSSLIRKQRQAPEGSATYDMDDADDEDYSGNEYDYDEGVEDDNLDKVDPDTFPAPPEPSESPHPHRHHHGESFVPSTPELNTHNTHRQTTEVENIDSITNTLTTVSSVITQETNVKLHSPPTTSVVSFPEITLPTEITTLDDTSQMVTETSTFPFSPHHTSDTSRPTAAIVSPTVEVSTFESSITLASPATQSTEDTASTTFATTLNANVIQDTKSVNTATSYVASNANDLNNNTETNDTLGRHLDIAADITTTPATDFYNIPNVPYLKASIDYADEDIIASVDSKLESSNSNITTSEETKLDIDEVTNSTPKETTSQDSTTTEKSSTIMGLTTETVDFTLPANSPPQILHRTKKVVVTAGKAFSYIIPEDLFTDAEDGTNLQLRMYHMDHIPLKPSSWIQFNPNTREVYGLPLEDHVSKWEYIVEATDTKGASVNDTLDITVQQHKRRRTVNHEFLMKLRLTKKYSAYVDWQIRVLKGLVNLFRDTDMDQITVRNIDLNADPIEFVWTNDTLPREICPNKDIDRLMGILQSGSDDGPSAALTAAMTPDLIIKSVTWKGTGACQGPPSTLIPQVPNNQENFRPMPRNQIDQLNAFVGQLLVYKVPEDSFYDHEDGNARNLEMYLTKGDGTNIHKHNWLQFDSKNQEFYGLPLERDKGRKEYILVCKDRAGQSASDGLIVDVRPPPPMSPPVEFRMAIETPYESFIQSSHAKRKFVENLYMLFGDKDASAIRIKSITDKPTMVSWYNISLPKERCPNSEIEKLKRVLTDNKSLTERVHNIMGTEFPVMSVSYVSLGACAVGGQILPEAPINLPGPNEDPSKTANTDEYIITFIIPIVVIICMIFIAALIACMLYRRRRSGKMSVGDDEERQAFRSKGIPVIFQDELDEKPDPSNKSPVIMKEEKPPLLPPPEYKGGDSSSPTPSHTPYHPPPPFTAPRDNGRNNRPKPTPAYRKPPPYVPP